jgi:hypothetical protein
MRQVSEGKGWQISNAHLLLLSKFRYGDTSATYADARYWEAALDETPLRAIARLLDSGMLEPADLPAVLDYRFKTTDLRTMLREKGLKVSGRKRELIQRLVANDPDGMHEATEGLNLYRCTMEGRRLAEQYLDEEEVKRTATEKDVLGFLQKRELSRVVRTVAEYEASQVFSRGVGVDWENHVDESAVATLRAIFEKTPEILKGMDANQLKDLRIAAGMMQLWGTNDVRRWLPVDFVTGHRLDADTACRMLIFHASYLRNMESYKELRVKTVRVRSVDDGSTCWPCRKISKKKYTLAQVPELPYSRCRCEIGCRCMTLVAEFR